MPKRITAAIAALLALSATANGADLNVGDPAPPLSVSEWVKGEPISALEGDATFVVEFWATWCGPCLRSIPHLTELQEQYEGEGLEIIGVSIWEDDYSNVRPFVEEMGDRMDYHVAVDEVPAGDQIGRMATDWMEAADQQGIPTAFIVRDGKIAWIGNPLLGLDEALAEVMSGDYDLDAAIAEARARAAAERTMRAAIEEIQGLDPDDSAGAIRILSEAMDEEPMLVEQFALPKFNLLLRTGDTDGAVDFASTLVIGELKDNPMLLNDLAWMLVDPQADPEVREAGAKLALDAATRAIRLAEGADDALKANIYDTVAAAHFANGDPRKALEYQRRAVTLSDGAVPEMTDRLQAYKKAAERSDGS